MINKVFSIPVVDINKIPIDKFLLVVENSKLHKKLITEFGKLPKYIIKNE